MLDVNWCNFFHAYLIHAELIGVSAVGKKGVGVDVVLDRPDAAALVDGARHFPPWLAIDAEEAWTRNAFEEVEVSSGHREVAESSRTSESGTRWSASPTTSTSPWTCTSRRTTARSRLTDRRTSWMRLSRLGNRRRGSGHAADDGDGAAGHVPAQEAREGGDDAVVRAGRVRHAGGRGRRTSRASSGRQGIEL